jgi:hypothetical protein
VIGNINQGVNPFKANEISFNPVTEGKILYVDVVSLRSGFWGIAHSSAPVMLSYAIVAASCGMLRSHEMLRTNSDIRPTLHAAMNSASVVDSGTVG